MMKESAGFRGDMSVPSDLKKNEEMLREITTRLEERREGPVEMLEIKSSLPPEEGRMNYNDDLLHLLKGIVKDGQMLDLFAGSQSTRAFFERNGIETQVTSVDITPGRTDLTINVADVAQHIPSNRQFACILALGAHPGFMRFDDLSRMLADDGYFVTGGSHEQFEKFDRPFFEKNGQLTDEEAEQPYMKDLAAALKEFHPTLIVKVNDIRGWYQEYLKAKGITARIDQTYVFWRKNTGSQNAA